MPEKLIRFGLFELNTSTRQLHKQGRRIRLQEQPLRALELLLEQPGRLVSRQELREKLWPSDVHVDFDLGLTGAMKRLRVALGDSAETPRFIETIPKAGYRFLAPVQVVSAAASAMHHAEAMGGEGAASTAVAMAPVPVPDRGPGPARSHTFLALVVGLVAVLGVAYVARPMSPPLAVTDVVSLTSSGRAWPQENLLTDGARLYYTEYSISSGFRLHQIVLNGNESSATAIPGGYLVRALSADRTTLLAINVADAQADTPSDVWALPVIGGAPRRVGNLQTNDFDWSPDGNLLVFARENQLFVSAVDGSDQRLIANLPGRVICPRWSPDARLIRFTVLGDGNESEIWETTADGHGLHRLVFPWRGTPMEGFGAWTADGRYFVFTSRRQGISDLWALEERAEWWQHRRTEPMQLSAGPISYHRPLASLDGRRMFAIGTEPGGELVSIKAGETFVPYLGGESIEHLAFSRDGAWVTYVAFPKGTLWRARVDGSSELQLTAAGLQCSLPHWSPDGKRIAFIGRKPGSAPKLFTISSDGGFPEPLMPSDTLAETDATWSPDGAQVVFARDPFGEKREIALYRFDLRTRRAERMAGTDGLYAPLWSPNGRYIVAQRTGSNRGIVLVDLESGAQTTLVDKAADYPTFSADSQNIYVAESSGDKPTIFRIGIADHREHKVADIPFKLVGAFGTWIGLAPDGSILVLRDRGQSNVYALSIRRQ